MRINQVAFYPVDRLADFFTNIDLVLAHKERILADPQLFHFHDPDWYLAIYMRKIPLCLGQLVLLWQQEPWFKKTPIAYYPNGPAQPAKYVSNTQGVYCFRHGGSPFSGTRRTTGWCVDRGEVVSCAESDQLFSAYKELEKQDPYHAEQSSLADLPQLMAYLRQISARNEV